MSSYLSAQNGMRSRTRSPPPVATRIVQGVPDTVKTKILAAADLFQV